MSGTESNGQFHFQIRQVGNEITAHREIVANLTADSNKETTLDIILLATECPKCPAIRLRATIVDGPCDEDGHSDEVEVEEIKCPSCGYIPDENDTIWNKALDLIYGAHQPNSALFEDGHIYEELNTIPF